MGAITTALLAVLIIAAVAGAAFFVLGQREKQATTRTARAKQQEQRRSRARSGSSALGRPRWLRVLPFLLLAGALGCLIMAVTQFTVDRSETQGAVVLTMDVSNSMNATDVEPSRLSAAQAAARSFLGEVPEGFRVGLVTFAGQAELEVPPMADQQQVGQALASLPTGKGTVIGDGLSVALDALEADWRASGKRPSAVLLLSDGNDTGSVTPPPAAAERARTLEVEVYTVVLGTVDPDTGTGADVALLESIADTTGGESFSAGSAGALTDIYERLGSELSVSLAVGGSGPLFVVLGAILAVAAGAVVLLLNRPQY